jgi:hypothetical protein
VLAKVLIALAVEILKLAINKWESLSPEEKERIRLLHQEWVKKCSETDDPMCGDGMGP